MKTGFRSFALFLLFTLISITSAQAVEETPWKTASGGAWLKTNLNWPNYNAGFDFTPNTNGTITKLGGLFNGTKTVRLYDTSTGAILATTSVTGNNTWQYGAITPVTVVAGKTYTVAVNTGWNGTSMSYGGGFPIFPFTTNNITLKRSVFAFGSQLPTNEIWGQMWGQPDITFIPGDVVVILPVP